MPALPLLTAYDFANSRGLQQQIQNIQNLTIADIPPQTQRIIRKGYIVDLFRKNNIFEDFVQQCWNTGTTDDRERRCNKYLILKQRFEEQIEDGNELFHDEQIDIDRDPNDSRDNGESQAFAAEHHLRDFLANNPACIESGLTIYQEAGRNGVEFVIDGGRIDILAKDSSDRFVVIELKLTRGRNRAVGQLLYYMGWVDNNLANGTPCRGIIIAKEIPEDLSVAVQRVSGVNLFRYNFSFTLEAIV